MSTNLITLQTHNKKKTKKIFKYLNINNKENRITNKNQYL